MESNRIDEKKLSFKLFGTSDFQDDFIPWHSGETGQQCFIKLMKNDDTAFLYAGVGSVMRAEIQKSMMKLLNDGWTALGEFHVSFDGNPDPLKDKLLCRDNLTVELGSALLPLVDTVQGAPLLESLNIIRGQLADSLGFVLPSINVKDNLALNPNQYIIKIRQSPCDSSEIFLDRFLAIGSMDNLSKINGWSVSEPAYKMPAKWIEIKDREAAESANCMVQGPLNVILTHISATITRNAKEVLGLQETADLISALHTSHPAVVDEFVGSSPKLRQVRKVLLGLLEERISIVDLVTIMEIIGDNMDDLANNIPLLIEHVRRGLAQQICWSVRDEEGYIRALTLNDDLEKRLKYFIIEALGGSYLSLSAEDDEKLMEAFRESLMENPTESPIIITDPAIRSHVSSFLLNKGIQASVLSASEILPEFKVVFIGEIKGNLKPADTAEAERPKKQTSSFWKRKLEQGS